MGNCNACESKSANDAEMSVPQVPINRAFVFVKPHAQTGLVRDLTRKTLESSGIQVDGEGEIPADTIDRKQLIDQHYYAIASKATLQDPSELPVPAFKFEETFLEKWDKVLTEKRAANALQACEQFGMSSAKLEELWRECEKEGHIVKFGGGFYCGKLTHEGKSLYVFNAFFMAMRAKFTAPGASIYYFSVSWDPQALSWADFRGKVLGPTDPSQAPLRSIRRAILEDWRGLGLKSAPDKGDNGVHASASPFEGLAERMNWLQRGVSEDPFGRAVIEAGVPATRVMAWRKDAQVVTGKTGERGSIFDAVEDMNVEPCLAKLVELDYLNAMNHAFVFIKPHAQNKAVQATVSEKLKKSGIEVVSEGRIDGTYIDAKQLIDQHYYAIASKATLLEPSKLPVPADKFQDKFGVAWDKVLQDGQAANAKQACEAWNISPARLEDIWKAAGDNIVKLGGGFYCGKVTFEEKTLYVFNAFFMSMRSKFASPEASIYYFWVEWEPLALSWADFRGKVLGPTDPAAAPEGALRRTLFDNWKSLGLRAAPDKGDNGVHASASPFEGLAERLNWLGLEMEDDPFGKLLLDAGIPKERIEAWSKDAQVTLASKEKGSIFDTLEDMDIYPCLQQLQELNKLNS